MRERTPATEFTPVTFTREKVPTFLRPRIDRKVKALTKSLAKLGAPAPTVTFGDITYIDDPRIDPFTRDLYGGTVDHDLIPKIPVFETVTVEGVEARHAGWTGVAVLDWTVNPDEAFVARFPGHDDETDDLPEISDELRTRGPICDHCNKIRSRNNTIVFNHDDGRTVTVGTTCVLEYLGVDPRTILMLVEFAKTFEADDDDFYGSNVAPAMSPEDFVALAAEITRHFGFVRSADEGSTKELTTLIGIVGLTNSKHDRELAAELADNIDMARGREKAAAIIDWLDNETSGSDFIRSARVAIHGNPVTRDARHAGILAALPFSHDRHIGLVAEREAKRKAEAEARKTAEFLGEIGDRLTVDGTVVFYNTYDGFYGVSARVTILTDDGNRVTTYGSGNTLFGWSSGDKVRMTGTVKDHDAHERYGKSTVLTRVKLIELGDDGNPLPECHVSRCKTGSKVNCVDCGKPTCGSHGRPVNDDFVCHTCEDLRWEKERANKDRSIALNKAARVLLGGEKRYLTGHGMYKNIDNLIIPEEIPA